MIEWLREVSEGAQGRPVRAVELSVSELATLLHEIAISYNLSRNCRGIGYPLFNLRTRHSLRRSPLILRRADFELCN